MPGIGAIEPPCILFLTGPGEDRDAILDGLRAIADEGARSGVRVALEPIQREFAELWSVVSSLDEAAALIAESGADVGLMYDTWHLWREPVEQIERHRERIWGVHLSDWREPTRNSNDRVLPGDGVIDFGPILHALRWDGLYDLEIFSDAELPGSLFQGANDRHRSCGQIHFGPGQPQDLAGLEGEADAFEGGYAVVALAESSGFESQFTSAVSGREPAESLR